MKGWVYVLASEKTPGILKVGRTSVSPEIRAKAVSKTFAGGPWRVIYAKHVTNMVRVEGLLHLGLRELWRPPGYEFFQTDLPTVIRHMEGALLRKLDETGDPLPVRKPGRRAVTEYRRQQMIQRIRIPQFYQFLRDRHDELVASGIKAAQIVDLFVAEHDPADPLSRHPSVEFAHHEWRRVQDEIAGERSNGRYGYSESSAEIAERSGAAFGPLSLDVPPPR